MTYYTYTSETKQLTPAPRAVRVDGVTYAVPTQDTLRRAGIYAYPLAADTPPTPPEGKIAVPDGYELRDSAWHRVYRYDDAPPPPPRTFSKYKLDRALQAEGVWLQVKEWLQSQDGAWDLYLAAEDISEDLKGERLYNARMTKRWGWLPLTFIWLTAPFDVAVDTIFLPYDLYSRKEQS